MNCDGVCEVLPFVIDIINMILLRQENISEPEGLALKKGLLSLVMIVAILSFVLFLTGFIIGAVDLINPKPSIEITQELEPNETGKTTDGKLHIVGLGDSLTRGMGDSEGIGYLGRFADLLKADWGQELSIANLAISGAKAPNLIKQLDDSVVQYAITQDNLIVLTIGGNDLNPGWEELEEVDLTSYEADVENFSANIRKIIDTLRTYNKEAEIYWLSLFNPFEEIKELKGSSENILRWNMTLESIALEYEDIFIIPTFDLFQTKTNKLLSKDHFHPNDLGYQLMAERLLQKVVLQLGIEKEDVSN